MANKSRDPNTGRFASTMDASMDGAASAAISPGPASAGAGGAGAGGNGSGGTPPATPANNAAGQPFSAAEIQLMTQLGFGGAGAISGTPNYLTRNPRLLRQLYRKDWLIRAMVDVPAADMTREGIKVTDGSLKGEEIDALHKSLSTKGVWRDFTKGVKQGRLFGGAIGVIVIRGHDMSSPLRLDTIGKNTYARLIVVERNVLVGSNINDLVVDPESPWYGTPRFYQMSYNYAGLPEGNIHHTRVIRFLGNELLSHIDTFAEQGWGISVVEPAYDAILDFNTVRRSITSLVRRASLRILATDGYDQAVTMGHAALMGLQARVAAMEMFQHNNSITMFDRKTTEFKQETVNFSSLPEVMQQNIVQAAGAVGIPVTLLFRDSPSGMNATGESDFKSYHYNVGQMQEAHRWDMDYLLNIMHRSTLGRPPSDAFDWGWNPLDKPSDAEQADMATKISGVAKAVVEVGAKPATGLKIISDASDRTGGILPKISQQEMQEANDEPPVPGEDDGEEGVPSLVGRAGVAPPLLPPPDANDPNRQVAGDPNIDNGAGGIPVGQRQPGAPASARQQLPAGQHVPQGSAAATTDRDATRDAATRDSLEVFAAMERAQGVGALQSPNPATIPESAKGAAITSYVARPVWIDDAKAIAQWAKDAGVPDVVKPADMHVTLVHSTRPIPNGVTPDPEGVEIDADQERRLAMFGDCLVLVLRSQDLQDRFAALRLAGASHDHGVYRPHITIAKCGIWGVDSKISAIQPYAEAIVLAPEEVREFQPKGTYPVEGIVRELTSASTIDDGEEGGGDVAGGEAEDGGAPAPAPAQSEADAHPLSDPKSVYAVSSMDPDTREQCVHSVHATHEGAKAAGEDHPDDCAIHRIPCGVPYCSHVSIVFAPSVGLVYGHRKHKKAMERAKELGAGGTKFRVQRRAVSP